MRAMISPPTASGRECSQNTRARSRLAEVDGLAAAETTLPRSTKSSRSSVMPMDAGRRRVRRVGGIGRRPRLDGAHPRVLLARHDHDVVADADAAALHPPGHDAAVVELVNRLHRETQRQIGGGAGRREGIERLQHRRPLVPGGRRRMAGDAVAVARGNRDDGDRCQPQTRKVAADLGFDLAEPRRVEPMRSILLMTTATPAAPRAGAGDSRAGGSGRGTPSLASTISKAASACAAPVIMLRRNSACPGASMRNDVARGSAEADLAGIDGDPLVAFGLQRVEQERHSNVMPRRALTALERVELAVGKVSGLVQQAADQGRFAVIDVADDDDTNQCAPPAARRRREFGWRRRRS